MEQNGFSRTADPWHLHAGADHSIRHIFKRHLPEQDGEVDKAPAISIMDATKLLPDEGLPRVRIICLCFGHDEELSDMRIASITAQWSREQGKLPALVLYQDGLIENSRLREGNPMAILPIMKNRVQSDISQIKKIDAPTPIIRGHHDQLLSTAKAYAFQHEIKMSNKLFFQDAYQVKMEDPAAKRVAAKLPFLSGSRWLRGKRRYMTLCVTAMGIIRFLPIFRQGVWDLRKG